MSDASADQTPADGAPVFEVHSHTGEVERRALTPEPFWDPDDAPFVPGDPHSTVTWQAAAAMRAEEAARKEAEEKKTSGKKSAKE